MKMRPSRFFASTLAAAGLFGAGILAERCWRSEPADTNPSQNGKAAAHPGSFTKFQTAPPASRSEWPESADNTEQRIEEQVGKVETARLKMMECMKKHSIVDVAPLQLEHDITGLNNAAEPLRGLKGSELIEAWVKHSVDSSSTNVYPEYRSEIAQLKQAKEDGLTEDDPKTKALKESIQSKHQRLEAHAEAYRDKLEEKLKAAQTMLAHEKEKHLRSLSPAEIEAWNEYTMLKQSYENEREALNALRETNMRAHVDVGIEFKSGHPEKPVETGIPE
jgi:hypothetical protein